MWIGFWAVAVVALGMMVIGYLDRRDGVVVAGAILEGALIIAAAIRGVPGSPSERRGFDVVMETRE